MESVDQPLPKWVGAAVIGSAFVILTAVELIRGLRSRRESKPRRVARNLTVAAIGGLTMTLAELPLVIPVARVGERSGWGLLRILGMPEPWQTVAALLLMDYTLYLWHVLTHRVPLLWRFHAPHHTDLDLDASTALRFHFGELLFSVPYRAAQVALIGVSIRAYSIWQTLLFASILFHHSNVRLPKRVESLLMWLIVTPRLHGIHHDATYAHLNSNWSSGLTVWDRIHRTLKTDVPQGLIETGVPGYLDPRAVTLPKVLAMPFRNQPK